MNGLIGSITPALPSSVQQPMSIERVAPARQSVDGFDAELFSRLLESQRSAAPAAVTSTPQPTGNGLGDKMLSRMSSMGDDFQKTWQDVADVVSGPDNTLSMQDMLRAQMHLVRVSTEYEVIGKVIGKSTQNVDQMLHMQ